MRTVILATAMLTVPCLGFRTAQADERNAANAQSATEARAVEKGIFTPPPGFRQRQRGKYVVYCRREEPKGSRFPVEVCYDEDRLRQLAQNTREDQMKVDQIRKARAQGSF